MTDADPREPLGRLVHDTRLRVEAKRAVAEGRERFRLKSWEERAPDQRELDMAIGEAVAVAEGERIAKLAEQTEAIAMGPDGRFVPFAGMIRGGAHDGRWP